jgi:cytochrome c-type biogenesis protein CcmH/NrfG
MVEGLRLCCVVMLNRFPPRVVHWLAAMAGGGLIGGLSQAAIETMGTGPHAILGGTCLCLILFGLARPMPPPAPLWRIGLIFPWIWIIQREAIDTLLTDLSHRLIESTAQVPFLGGVVFAAALWPSMRILSTAIQPKPTRTGPLLFGAGLLVGSVFIGSEAAVLLGAIGLLLSDTTAQHERGWSPHTPNRQPVVPAAILGGVWLASGWVLIRTTFDPTLSGVCAVAMGVCFGRTLNIRLPTMLWAGALGGLIWISAFLLETGAPQLAALGMNHTLGVDGRLWLALPLATLGLLAAPLTAFGSTRSRLPAIGLAIGLWTGPTIATHQHAPWIAAIILGLIGLFSQSGKQRGVSLALALCIVVAGGWLAPANMRVSRTGIWASASNSRALATWAGGERNFAPRQHGQTGSGAFVSWEGTGDGEERGLSLDGSFTRTGDPAAQAEALTGHLAVLLAPKREPHLLLGDWMGNALRSTAVFPPGMTHISVPSAHALRAIAATDPVRERLWLQPVHPLYGEHPAVLTRRTPPVQAITEINHGPWTSGANWGLSTSHIRSVRNHLVANGVYVLCVHLRWWGDGAIPRIAQALTESFSSVTAWLPPEGVDSLIFVATDSPPAFGQVASRFSPAKADLASLGLHSPEMLAGSAILGDGALRKMATTAFGPLQPQLLSASIFERPTLHLGQAPALMADQADPWNGTAPEGVSSIRAARATMLEMLEKATRGELEGAFEAARLLAEAHGSTGIDALEGIIAPHLSDGRTALGKAIGSGPNSSAWDDAMRFATTARMLAPKSHTPLTLLGEIALARGHLPAALKYFQDALRIEPGHVQALEGLARCARLSNAPKKVEQALRDATRHAPRDWRTWSNLAVFHLEQGQDAEAMTTVETAMGLAPATEVRPLLIMTKTLLRLGSAGAALLRADQATKLAPKNGLGWYLRGRAHFDLNRMTEAEKDFRAAVLTDADLVEARSGIGLVRAIIGDEKAARRIFRDVLQRDPDNAAARENLRRLGSPVNP